ncbi:MAG: hypothetical protein AB8G15_03945 [Saprospiraceae bacterium]
MKNLWIVLCFLGTMLWNTSTAQENVWRTLAMIKMEKDFSSMQEGKELRFGPLIKRLEGKEITVRGYIIPLSGKKGQSHFMFSAYPYSNCFFCGKAGPESVMEVFIKDDKKVDYSEKIIKIKGTFAIRSSDPNDIMYQLSDAVLVKD